MNETLNNKSRNCQESIKLPYQTKGLWALKGQEPGCLEKSADVPQGGDLQTVAPWLENAGGTSQAVA